MRLNGHNRTSNLSNLKTPLSMYRRIYDFNADASTSLNSADVASSAIESPDLSKIAPYANTTASILAKQSNPFRKKTRPKFYGVGEDGEDALYTVLKKDPDRFPWRLCDGNVLKRASSNNSYDNLDNTASINSNDSGLEWDGVVEGGSRGAHYVLLKIDKVCLIYENYDFKLMTLKKYDILYMLTNLASLCIFSFLFNVW